MDESPFGEDAPVVTMTEAQSEGENTKTDARIWHGVQDNEGLDTVKPALPEVLQESDRTDKEWILITRARVSEKANGAYCREFGNTTTSGDQSTHSIGMQSWSDMPE